MKIKQEAGQRRVGAAKKPNTAGPQLEPDDLSEGDHGVNPNVMIEQDPSCPNSQNNGNAKATIQSGLRESSRHCIASDEVREPAEQGNRDRRDGGGGKTAFRIALQQGESEPSRS